MKLRTIEDSNLEVALTLLLQGFPHQTEAFWRTGIARACMYMQVDHGWPLGFLLEYEGVFHGVILTLPSYRDGVGSGRTLIVNLSSWYVSAAHRGLAYMMLLRLLASPQPVYTDLTPSHQVLRMIDRLKFTMWNQGVMLTAWPLTPQPSGSSSEIVPLEKLPADGVSKSERQLLEDHESLGCLSGAMYDGNSFEPLVLQRTRFRGIPSAHVVYSRSRRRVLGQLRPIAGFALRRGLPVLSLDVDQSDCPTGSYFRPRGIKAFRGAIPRDRIDSAYSELIYFDLPPY